MKKTLIPLIFAMMISTVTQAAFITIDEAGMDGVFSQGSFGANTVDIRIGATTEIVRPAKCQPTCRIFVINNLRCKFMGALPPNPQGIFTTVMI